MKLRWPRDLIEPRPATNGPPAGGGSSSSPFTRVKTWAGDHKAIVGLGAVGVVVFLAYRSRSSSAAAAGGTVPTDSTVGNPQGAAIAGYDSSASDIYNALQPQIDQTQGLIRKLMVRIRQDRLENRRVARQLRRTRRRRASHHTATPKDQIKAGPVIMKRTRLTAGTGTAQRRLPTPAPVVRPRAVVTRRPTTMAQIGAADRTPHPQIAALNRGLPATGKLPANTRVVLPPKGGRR